MFWIPTEQCFVKSAWSVLSTASVVISLRLEDLVMIWTPTWLCPLNQKTTSTHLLEHFVMNPMQLWEFSGEIEFHDQILDLSHFYAIKVPKTFKPVMKSLEKDAWSKAISIELKNLDEGVAFPPDANGQEGTGSLQPNPTLMVLRSDSKHILWGRGLHRSQESTLLKLLLQRQHLWHFVPC
jgi:hypothetical protein